MRAFVLLKNHEVQDAFIQKMDQQPTVPSGTNLITAVI